MISIDNTVEKLRTISKAYDICSDEYNVIQYSIYTLKYIDIFKYCFEFSKMIELDILPYYYTFVSIEDFIDWIKDNQISLGSRVIISGNKYKVGYKPANENIEIDLIKIPSLLTKLKPCSVKNARGSITNIMTMTSILEYVSKSYDTGSLEYEAIKLAAFSLTYFDLYKCNHEYSKYINGNLPPFTYEFSNSQKAFAWLKNNRVSLGTTIKLPNLNLEVGLIEENKS